MLPTVSIVTPSYNQGRFLRRTIESILRQDYPYVEYLVFDGGSTDDSISILSEYGNRFFWRSEPDNGQTHAINKGLSRAHGDIVAYLNSDDVLLPGALSTIVAHFQGDPDCDLVYGNAWHIDEEDRFLSSYPTAACNLERLLQDCCICQPAAFWRRRVVDRIGLLDEKLHYAMDYEYWLRLTRAGGRLVHVPNVLACSRLYPQTKTLSARTKVYEEILEVSRRHAPEASFSQYYAYWHHRCPPWLRRWPQCHWWLAVAHQRWHRHCGRGWLRNSYV